MHRPTYAELTSTLALFLALGGVSWAATTLPKNSVTSATIRDGQVGASDLAKGAVSATALSKSLRTQLGVTAGKGVDGPGGAPGSSGSDGRSGADGKAGPQGAEGPVGAAGPTGAAGRDGAGLIAIKNFGTHTVVDKKFIKIGEIVWTQPAHAVDDIRGTYTAMASNCSGGQGAVGYQLVVDGNEVSYDIGNSGVGIQTDADHPDARIVPPWGNQAGSDRGTFGAELPIVSGDVPATHKLEMYLRNDLCPQYPVIKDVTAFITRFQG